jgi:hypothetical protein
MNIRCKLTKLLLLTAIASVVTLIAFSGYHIFLRYVYLNV